jgi:hypothetical protein
MRLVINYFKKHPYALVMVIVMVVWMTINSIEGAKATKRLAKEGVYTLATIREIKGAKSGRWVKVSFMYDGKQYETEARNEAIPLSWIGEKIFIKFLPSRPIEAEYLDSFKVTDSLLQLPPTIWKSLPATK